MVQSKHLRIEGGLERRSLEERAITFLPESRHRNGVVQEFDILGPGIRKASMFLVVRGQHQMDQEEQQDIVARCLGFG